MFKVLSIYETKSIKIHVCFCSCLKISFKEKVMSIFSCQGHKINNLNVCVDIIASFYDAVIYLNISSDCFGRMPESGVG